MKKKSLRGGGIEVIFQLHRTYSTAPTASRSLQFEKLAKGEAMTNFSLAELEGCIEKAKQRAQVDPLFRVLALHDAKEALGKIRGASVPADLAVVFVEPGPSAAKHSAETRVVILDKSEDIAEELSDDDLENVAGGGDGSGTGMTGGW